MKELLKEKWFE